MLTLFLGLQGFEWEILSARQDELPFGQLTISLSSEFGMA
ncbi:hypothetical protein H4W30_004990 [Amycolatopsis roodepoortensis]|uniref:Uncharacterized protein n=1 Tax=Amycolatopsis roodepoortensis TaxID=700274 RepID=A0ABR9LC96_9PSEU|nr:hypothetical protein [Amycolatopsis roodepoortensis]